MALNNYALRPHSGNTEYSKYSVSMQIHVTTQLANEVIQILLFFYKNILH